MTTPVTITTPMTTPLTTPQMLMQLQLLFTLVQGHISREPDGFSPDPGLPDVTGLYKPLRSDAKLHFWTNAQEKLGMTHQFKVCLVHSIQINGSPHILNVTVACRT